MMSTSLTFLSVLLLQLLHQSVVGADTNKAQFTLLTQFKCDGVAVCAVSQPNKTMSVTSKAQCVLYCQHQRQQPESCVGINYQDQNNTCDVFYYEVTEFKKSVTGCQYIRVLLLSITIVMYTHRSYSYFICSQPTHFGLSLLSVSICKRFMRHKRVLSLFYIYLSLLSF